MVFDGLSVLRRLQELDETVEIAAKLGSEAGDAVMKTVSSFANEPGRGGGYILFGVRKAETDDGVRYDVRGVEDPDALSSDFVSQCASMLNDVLRPVVDTFRDPDTGRVLVSAFIREAEDHQKPVYIKKYGLPRGAFRRISGHDVRCTDDDLEVLFRRGDTATYDETLVREATFDDLDPEAFEAYRRMRSDREAPELAFTDLELARAIVAVKRTGSSAAPEWTPTIAGLLLFGRRSALRRLFPMLRIDYIRVPSTEWIHDPENRFDTVEILEPLLLAVPRVIQNTVADIPRGFRITNGSVERHEAPLVPALAIREAIVNAVMHRSYRTRQPLQIIRYNDRVEIRNPGASLVPEDRLGEPGSVSRNEKMAAILHETKLAENKGSGIGAMRRSMEAAGVVPPTFHSDRDRDEFIATFRMQHFLDASDLAWLAQFKSHGLSEDHAKALVFVRRNGAISNSDYRALNHVDTHTASVRLRDLRESGFIVPEGAGAGTIYRPGPTLLHPIVTKASSKTIRRPSRLDRELLFAALPPALQEEIAKLPKPAPGYDVDDLIIRILDVQPMSAGQLAVVLSRTRSAILRATARLARAGQITQTQSDPYHPFQSYIRVEATRDVDRAAEQGTLFASVKSPSDVNTGRRQGEP